jgi:hypothetical protein
LFCNRIFRTDAEAAYWEALVKNGDIAIGKPMNVVSADDTKPDPGAASCSTRYGPENEQAHETRVTGFAHQANICGVSYGQWKAGYLFSISVCGVTIDGKTSAFFAAPPPPP